MFKALFTDNNDRITKHLRLFIILVFLLNFILKLFYLDFSPFWYDEIISVQSASLNFGHIKHVSEWDKNPPFYYYCLSIWIKIFNDSEFYVRLLSVFFSSLAASFLFVFANKYFNKTTAIISSFLFLSSNTIFFYSHEARVYSLVLLLALISSYLFFKIKEKPIPLIIFLLGLTNFLLIYSHYISGLIIFFQSILIFFFFTKREKIYYVYSLLTITLLVLLRFTLKQILLIINFNKSESSFWLKKSSFAYLEEVFSVFLLNQKLVIPFIIIIIFGIFIVLKFKKQKDNFVMIYCFLISFGAILTLFFLGKLTPIFLDRYLIFSIPFLFLLVAYPLSLFRNQKIILILSLIFCIIFIFRIDFKTEKVMDYKNTVNFIKSIKNKDDLIIVKTIDVKPIFCYYYDRDFFSKNKKDLPLNENIVFCTKWNDISNKIADYKRVIVIDSFEDLNPNELNFISNISKIRKRFFQTKYYKGVTITFYN